MSAVYWEASAVRPDNCQSTEEAYERCDWSLTVAELQGLGYVDNCLLVSSFHKSIDFF